MNFRLRKRGYSLLIMIASPLLALGLGGVGWATVCSPGGLNFLELDVPANVGFNGTANFDWAFSGANCSGTGNVCTASNLSSRTCPTNASTGSIECTGTTGGIFDDGKFNGSKTPPTPPTETTVASAPGSGVISAVFGVDALSVDLSSHCSKTVLQQCGTGFTACPAGETCIECDGDPTVYTGMGGETNGDLINSETWGAGSVPNKDEISNVYAIAHQVPPNPDTTKCTTCTVSPDPSCNAVSQVYAGFERVVNNGDSHVDLEFLQGSVSLVSSTKNACTGVFNGHRTEGDLLLSVDFTTGGTLGSRALHVWHCGDCPKVTGTNICDPCKVSGKQVPAQYVEVTNEGHCSNAPAQLCGTGLPPCPSGGTCSLLVADAISQTINSTGPVGCGGWACRKADGTGPVSTIDKNEFYEVGIDLAGIGFSGCISTFLPHTRSSQSFTATLKDFTVIPFNTCVPSTNLTKCVKGPSDTACTSSTTVDTGDSVTYTYTEQNDGNVALTSPCPSATDKRSCFVTDDTCSGVTYQSGDTNNNNILDPLETWTFTCTQTVTCTAASHMCTVTNTAKGHGIFTPPGSTTGQDVTFCDNPSSPPPATFCDQDEKGTATVMVLAPSTAVTKSVKSTSVVTTVVYNYTEKNNGKIALTPPGGTSNPVSAMVDTDCTGNGGTMSLTSGDTNTNGKLDPGETWNFACTATYTGTGPFSDTATGHGCFTSGGKTQDVTFGTAASACGSGSSVFPISEERATACVNLTCGACPP